MSANIFTNEPYDNSELSVDPATGLTIVRTRLSILFKPTTTPEQVNGLLARINATITAAIAGSRSAGIRIPDPGTVAALNLIIADIESETFVAAVMKSVHLEPGALPDNVIETSPDDLSIIDNQLAIGGPAAWNAKEAIVAKPSVIIMDWFGDGRSQLDSFLDTSTSISGIVLSGALDAEQHGYHVAGILNGSFGGGSSTAALVTGIMPGSINLGIIDRTDRISYFDSNVQSLLLASAMNGTVIFNTSIHWVHCWETTLTGTCTDVVWAMNHAITWADQVRAMGMESKMFHATIAGNRSNPRYEARDAETKMSYAAAALMTDMATTDGVHVPPLTNTMVVENLSGTGHPREVECLDENSFIGGTISAIGTDVTSLSFIGTKVLSGTSMAGPQVAGLAAYMVAIDPSLSPQKIKEILLNTAQTVPAAGGVDCSDATAAPAIDAYAAVLALDDDSALSGGKSNAPVRNAILDVSIDGTTKGTNNQFDENDLRYYIEQIDQGNQEKNLGTANVKYSRADLNGDGYDGGRDGFKKKFNLDIDYPPTYGMVTQDIEGNPREFDESSLSDDDILCYYAYSDLYTGSTTARTNLMGSRCNVSKVAVYYEHTNQIVFPPALISCGNTNDDMFDPGIERCHLWPRDCVDLQLSDGRRDQGREHRVCPRSADRVSRGILLCFTDRRSPER